MTTLTVELSPHLFGRLTEEAERRGKPAQAVAEEWLTERLNQLEPADVNERERVSEALRSAGLLSEPGPEMRHLAAGATMTLEEVRAALDRVGGKPLSELILEMRGPKE